MKRNATSVHLAVYMIILSALFTLSVFLLYFAGDSPKKAVEKTVPVYVYVTDTASSAESDPPSVWFLRDYEGRIGIFDEKGVPLYLLDTYVKTLPKADQALLREGIRVENEAQLRSLIEDYTE